MTEPTPPSHLLLAGLNEEQTALVETLYEGFELRGGTWPVWQFADLRLESGRSMLPQSSPLYRRWVPPGPGRTAWCGAGRTWSTRCSRMDLGLTVAGLGHVRAAGPLPEHSAFRASSVRQSEK